jgi:hypothetical protein
MRPNFGQGGMKRIVEESESHRVEPATYYSASTGIRAGRALDRMKNKGADFWPAILESIRGVKLSWEDEVIAEECVQAAIEWMDPVESTTSFVEAARQHYEVMVEETRKRVEDQAKSSKRYDAQEYKRKLDMNMLDRKGATEKGKGRVGLSFRLRFELEQRTDMMKILEDRVLNGQIAIPLGETLGIVKKEFHDAIIGMIKKKRQVTEEDRVNLVHASVNVIETEVYDVDGEMCESLFTSTLGASNY